MPIGNCDTCEKYSEELKYKGQGWRCPKCLPKTESKGVPYTSGTANNELKGRFKGNRKGGTVDKILERGREVMDKEGKL